MDKTLLTCPLCCNESFNSAASLKIHILDVLSKIECPICNSRFSAFQKFIKHLKDCGTVQNVQTNKVSELEIEIVDEANLQATNTEENNTNEEESGCYCEICDVHFVEMKKHLRENHMGEHISVESQNLDEIMKESEVVNDDDSNADMKSEAIKHSDTEHIFLEQEILDEDGKFYTKKLTKIDIIQEKQRTPPVIEKMLFKKSSDENAEDGLTIQVYRCLGCNIRFHQINTYNKHDCRSKKNNICDVCSIYFANKSNLSNHKKKCHGEIQTEIETQYNCVVCKIQFPTVKSLLLHSKIHGPITQRTIDSPVSYNTSGEVISEETNETFTCEICGKIYNKKYEDAHMKSHTEKFVVCSICNRKFSDKKDLSLHLQAHGNDVDKKISCRFCKKTFNFKEPLEDHIENHCVGKKYGCSYCGRKFSKPHEMVKHERIHTGLKPYVCEICNKAFRVSYCLTLHMRTHSGVRPYQCKICDKRFKSHSAFNHHSQIHSDVRPYQCPFCPKAFKNAVQLAGHKNSHTKPFSCNICNRPFASLYAVRLHTKSHEKKNLLKHQCHICGAKYVRFSALQDHVAKHSESNNENYETSIPPECVKIEITIDEKGRELTNSDIENS